MSKYCLSFIIVFYFSVLSSFSQFMELGSLPDTRMLDPQFWIDRTTSHDKIIMSPSMIRQWNKQQKFTSSFEKMALDGYVDSLNLSESITSLNIFPHELYDSVGNIINDSFFEKHLLNQNFHSLKGKNSIQYGIITCLCEIRKLPTAMRAYQDKDNCFFDELICSTVSINDKVLVVHSSLDNNWMFVYTDCFSGWIDKKYVALCSSYNQWMESDDGDLLVVTANKLYVSSDDLHNPIEADMGTFFKLLKKESFPNDISGRHAMFSYIVEIPAKDDNGNLVYNHACIPYNQDVHIGYLDYTISNLLSQSFKMIGDRYGWGGMFHSRDCSSYIRDVYKCFGFKIARNSLRMTEMNTHMVDLSQIPVSKKAEYLLSELKPGVILYFKGHVVMYLGAVNGIPYVINALSSLEYNGKKHYVQSIMINSMYDIKANGQSFIDKLEKCIFIK